MYFPLVHVILMAIISAGRVDASTPRYSTATIEGHLPGLYFEYISLVYARIDEWTTMITIDIDKIKPQHSYNDQISSLLTECPGSYVDCEVQVTQSRRLQRKLDQVVDKLEDLEHLLTPDTRTYVQTDFPSPSVDSTRVLGRETQILRLYQEVEMNYDAAINEARIPGGNTPVNFFRAVQTWTMSLEDLLDVHTKACDETIEAIKQAIKGYVSHHLLDTTSLEKVISHANSRFSNAKVPVTDFTIEEIRTLIGTTVSRKGSLVTIKLNFPLYSTTHYLLYRMHPIPIPQGDLTSAHIMPPKQYMLVLRGQYNHTFFSEEDLARCKQTATRLFCLSPPILRPTSCEIQLLVDSQDYDLRTCNIQRQTHTSITWIYLPESNEWIYSTPETTSVTIQCQSNYTDVLQLNGLGMFKLDKGCIAKTKDAVLNPRNNGHTSSYVYSSTITFNLTQQLTATTQETTEISRTNSQSIEKMVLILYCLWPLSILISMCGTAILTHYFYKRKTKPTYQPVPVITTTTEHGPLPIVRQTQTEIDRSSIAIQATEETNMSESSTQTNEFTSTSETTYEYPPPPKPVIFPPPTAYSTSTKSSPPIRSRQEKFATTLPTINEIA